MHKSWLPTSRPPSWKGSQIRLVVAARWQTFTTAACKFILAPITACGETGIPMMSGDGIWRRCHPIYAVFVGDYPEQVLVTCTYNNRCPKCLVPYDELGSYTTFPPRDYDKARDAYLLADGDAHAFHSACREAGQKPVFHPFWESLPLTNVFISITPDILHQLLQGVLQTLGCLAHQHFGASEIDARCRSITTQSPHLDLCQGYIHPQSRNRQGAQKHVPLLLGLVLIFRFLMDKSRRGSLQLCAHYLDFLYLAQLPSHSSLLSRAGRVPVSLPQQ
jgi:hypothetical protein